MRTRTFVNVEDGHKKFWAVEIGKAMGAGPFRHVPVTFRWGRIGTAGQVLVKEFKTSVEAVGFVLAKIDEKRYRNGYTEIAN